MQINKIIVGLIAFAMIIGLTGVVSATTIFESDVPETTKTSGFYWEISYDIVLPVLPDGCFKDTITGSETGSFTETIGDDDDIELNIIAKAISTYWPETTSTYWPETTSTYWPETTSTYWPESFYRP